MRNLTTIAGLLAVNGLLEWLHTDAGIRPFGQLAGRGFTESTHLAWHILMHAGCYPNGRPFPHRCAIISMYRLRQAVRQLLLNSASHPASGHITLGNLTQFWNISLILFIYQASLRSYSRRLEWILLYRACSKTTMKHRKVFKYSLWGSFYGFTNKISGIKDPSSPFLDKFWLSDWMHQCWPCSAGGGLRFSDSICALKGNLCKVNNFRFVEFAFGIIISSQCEGER